MKLTELFLNRFLYKDNSQNLETKDSAFIAADSTPIEPVALSSGGAAQDINTGNVTINGGQLTPGTYPVTVLDIANWGWGQTCAFSSVSSVKVDWGTGTFKSADGTSYTISAGTTGTMSAKTYIYFDVIASPTTYQITTVPGNAVGIGKVLIAVAQNASSGNATWNLNQATQITADNILANSIDASKITTGQLVVGTNVGLGTAQDSSGVTTIIGNTVTTGFVNALSVTAGSVAAENITGTYITGKTIRTASSGTRIVIDGAANEIDIYNGSTLRAQGYENGWNYYNASGTEIGSIYASGTEFLLTADLNSNGSMYYGAGASGSHSMHIGTGASTTRFYVEDTLMTLGDIDDFTFDVQTYGILNLNNGLGMDCAGYCVSDSLGGGTNVSGMSLTHTSTGIYTITHGLGTANYTVLITLRKSTATVFAVISSHTNTSFTVRIGDAAGTLTDCDFDFAMFKWN